MEVLSLYDICLYEISEILVKCQTKVPTSDNPFRVLPPIAVHDLIQFILNNVDEVNGYLKSSYLYLLLISGRITSLKLTEVLLLSEDAEEIFDYLQPHSEKLKSIEILHLFESNSENIELMSPNFGTLLHSAKNLVSLESSISFKLSELSSCFNLEKLVLNFRVTDLTSFLYVGDEIRYNHSLKILRILKCEGNEGLWFDIAHILQYCVEIIEIGYNIAPSLIYLHESQKATKYKLQKACLGESKETFRIPSEIVQIASLYCPELRMVHATTLGYPAIRTFCNFSQITELHLEDPKWPHADFNQGVRYLLENSHFGHNLKSLALTEFAEIDYTIIGACCPNLEELRVGFISEYIHSEFTTNSFQKLISLYIKHCDIDSENCERDCIIGILSKATLLEFLTLDTASMLDDTALDAILENTEAFSKLITLNLNKCGLSIAGFKKLVQSMVSIQFISYNSLTVSLEDTESVLKSMDITRYEEE